MLDKIPLLLLLLTLPAAAETAQLHDLRVKDAITLVLPGGECTAKVTGRDLDRLTLRLKSRTAACGQSGSLVTLSRADVRDVTFNDRHRLKHQTEPLSGVCAARIATLVGIPAGLYTTARTGSGAGGLTVLLASAAAGAILCHDRGARYTVFAERIAPVLP